MNSPPLPPAEKSKPPAKAPPPNGRQNANVTNSLRSFAVSQGVTAKFHKVVIYGPGGAGKTELCSNLQQLGLRVLMIDIEDGSGYLDVPRVDPAPESLEEVRSVLNNRDLLDDFDAVVIDSFTKLEELVTRWTLENIKTESGEYVRSIEGYGYGKGYTHVFESFLPILSDLDAVNRTGKHVIAVCHECTSPVPNPGGMDWIRFEPRLQAPTSGKASIRHRVKEWCSHLLFIGFDTFVQSAKNSKHGKATGSGTRTIYPTETPQHWAKSRSLSAPIPYSQGDAELWRQLLQRGEA